MLDVLIAGAGPAGFLTAVLLARAGARVVIVDRDEFPRPKLCGDTLNPGAVRLLASLDLTGGPLSTAHRLRGMHLTGPGASVSAEYGSETRALALTRYDFDAWLLGRAVDAGARFEAGMVARRPLLEDRGGRSTVRGLVLSTTRSDHEQRIPAMLTVAADGRRSAIARALQLTSERRAPRRWAYGTYATGVRGITDMGEMHIRHGWYLGVAPLSDTQVNLCVVRPGGSQQGLRPMEVIRRAIAEDERLAARFEDATFDDHVRVMGPLAADVQSAAAPGLLLAGDAAGFVDPMTGDGVHLALQSAVLAAREALHVLETGDASGAVRRFARARRARFGRKIRFNRLMRSMVDSRYALDAASAAARVVPSVVRGAVRYAGDVG